MTDQNNNIGLVRLVAACQVMVGHLLDLVPGAHTEVTRVTGYLPGVPVFFFLSGFLITGSWMRNPITYGAPALAQARPVSQSYHRSGRTISRHCRAPVSRLIEDRRTASVYDGDK